MNYRRFPYVKKLLLLPALISSAIAADAPIPERPEYNRDIRPILGDSCFRCHGFDKATREADLRLDVREAAVEDRDGIRAIVPNNPAKSEMWLRMISDDEEEVMPPPKAHRQLSAREKAMIKKWIEQGAEYQPHYAYIPPTKPAVPKVELAPWKSGNPVDAFIRAKQLEHTLSPSKEADRATLARRLSLDLTGLPPKPEEIDAFIRDAAPDAYGKMVERLLASPHFGERMAVWWLDLVRFADTIGYHSDNSRNIWPYRDYVIRAFNENKRFDRFTVEQIAGDLLPDANLETRVASAYNRLILSTEEGGAQPKQYEAKHVVDRVKSIGTTWLAQTFMCSECHDHKFDPVTAKDFYALGAFFADIEESSVGKRETGMIVAPPEQLAKLTETEQRLAALRAELAAPNAQLDEKQAQWEKNYGKVPDDVLKVLKLAPSDRTAGHVKKIATHFRSIAPELADLRKKIADLDKERDQLDKSYPRVLVSNNKAKRTVRILPRGDWQNESGEVVLPATPAFLPAFMESTPEKRLTRLDLANWLIKRENPLTARVFMNRLWKQFYGAGLSRTLEDIGTQSELPANPQLLDWLAVEFVDRGWDVKAMVRLLVTSDAYRQSSIAAKEIITRDPLNRDLTRQTRWRLDAEFIRDNALTISGLLVDKIGGPSVKPYQPAGYWENLNFPTREWAHDTNENQWRRGLYVWWQRSYVHPAMLAFDAPTREECSADRVRSNIPQQALVLLNDPQFVESARTLAARMIKEGGPTAESRIAWAWKLATSRTASADEIKILTELLAKHQQEFANSKTLDAFLTIGLKPVEKTPTKAELAAYTSVARAILNLYETVSRP